MQKLSLADLFLGLFLISFCLFFVKRFDYFFDLWCDLLDSFVGLFELRHIHVLIIFIALEIFDCFSEI